MTSKCAIPHRIDDLWQYLQYLQKQLFVNVEYLLRFQQALTHFIVMKTKDD